MKKILAILLLASVAAGAWAQEETTKAFTLDGGAGLSFGLFDKVSSEFGDLSGLATLASVRGGVDVAALYRINDFISAGAQLGIYTLQYTPTGGSTYTFFDIPVRAVAKIGMKGFAIQPYVGYYIAPVGFPFPGLEAGARAIVGPMFVEGSMVMGNPQWTHVALGVQLENFLEF